MTEQTGEDARVAATHRLLQSAPLGALDVVTSLAAQMLRTTSAEVSLVTDVRHTVTAAGETADNAGSSTSRTDSFCAIVVEEGEPLVVADAVHDVRVRDRRPVVTGFLGSYLGVPMVADDGSVVGSLCVHQHEPRGWSAHDQEILTELASAATGHLEIAALTDDYRGRQRAAELGTAATAAGIGTWEWNFADDSLVWDDVLLKLFGLTPETFGGRIDSFNAAVHPEDLPEVTRALTEAIATSGVYEAQFRILRPDGAVRWIAARGKPSPGPEGRIDRFVGAVTDLTALRRGEARIGTVLDTMAVGYVALDREGRFSYANAEAERVLATPRAQFLGRTVQEAFPGIEDSAVIQEYRRVADGGANVSFDAYYPPPLDAWFEVRIVPVDEGVGIYFLDISERRAAQQEAERNAERAAALAEVAGAFAETLDAEQALLDAVRSLVPRFADWTIVSTLDGGTAPWRKRLRDVGAWHHDPLLRGVLEEYRGLRVEAFADDSPVRDALTRGTVALLDAAALPPGHLLRPGRAHELLHDLAPAATVVLPLRGRGRTRGLLTVARTTDREPFSAEDVATLEEVSRQIGLGLDNAQLSAAQRGLAEELQLSLLTELPRLDDLQLVARYVAAADGAQVGGDWYDGFTVADGGTFLVIGDVTGHDRGAAAAMAQVRNVLRGVAHALGDSPARILEALERAMRDLAVDTLGTAVLARVEQGTTDTSRVLRWSSAGHLPPLVVHADGRAELLDRPHDLLLGLDSGLRRHDHTVPLLEGDTLLLYTDGLVERRDEDLDEGLDRLQRNAVELVGLPADRFCDALLERMSPGSEDDIALLLLRVHPTS